MFSGSMRLPWWQRLHSMDPDALLSEIREILDQAVDPDYERLAECIDALGQWLFAGGYLPHDWKVRGSGCQ